MKPIYIFFITISLLFSTFSSLQAQTTEGKEFWLTFGTFFGHNNPLLENYNMQIRIVTGNFPTSVTIYFTHLDVSESFYINACQVYTYTLNSTQKYAVCNTTTGTTDFSIRISSSEPFLRAAVATESLLR